MSRDVCERFLNDSVGRDFDGRPERRQCVRGLDLNSSFTRRLTRREPLQGCHEPELVERGRTQPVDQAANVSDHRLHLSRRRCEQFVGTLEVGLGEVPHGIERERQACQ
jgi:hypothetical protein